jgi:hypothetical protein
MAARTFCSWKATIFWNTGSSTDLTSGGPIRSESVFEIAEGRVEDTMWNAAKASTGDRMPVHVTLELFNFHTEAID